MGTFGQWRNDPWQLPEVDLEGFAAATIGASLSSLDGRRVISVVVNEQDGTAVVLALTQPQLAALDAPADEAPDDNRSERARLMAKFQAWLRALDLDENEVIGRHVDPVFVGFVLEEEHSPPART